MTRQVAQRAFHVSYGGRQVVVPLLKAGGNRVGHRRLRRQSFLLDGLERGAIHSPVVDHAGHQLFGSLQRDVSRRHFQVRDHGGLGRSRCTRRRRWPCLNPGHNRLRNGQTVVADPIFHPAVVLLHPINGDAVTVLEHDGVCAGHGAQDGGAAKCDNHSHVISRNYGMVMNRAWPLGLLSKVLLLVCCAGCVPAPAQTSPPAGQDATALYRELLNPTLSVADVHQVREIAIDREDLHIVISDGTLGLIRAVDGRVTGAVFEGSGEILLVPPDRVERTSLALFTGAGMLEQSFNSAYFRFFDDKLLEEFRAGFRKAEAENVPEFVGRWEEVLKTLAPSDALHVLRAMTNAQAPSSHFLHARLAGTQLGVFDVRFDANAPEQISVGQSRVINNVMYYDTWMSFPMRSARTSNEAGSRLPRFDLSDYRMKVQAQPPTDLTVRAEVTLTPRRAGQRTFILELSRHLRVTEVRADGQPAVFIQNPAIGGSELARRGDDLVCR